MRIKIVFLLAFFCVNFIGKSQNMSRTEGVQTVSLLVMKKGYTDTFVNAGIFDTKFWFVENYRIELFESISVLGMSLSLNGEEDDSNDSLRKEIRDSTYCLINTSTKKCFVFKSFDADAPILDSFMLPKKPQGISEPSDTVINLTRTEIRDTVLDGKKFAYTYCNECKDKEQRVDAYFFFDDEPPQATGAIDLFSVITKLYGRRVNRFDAYKPDRSEGSSFRVKTYFGLNTRERAVIEAWINREKSFH